MTHNPSIGVGGKRTGKKPVPGYGAGAIRALEMYFDSISTIFSNAVSMYYSVFPSGVSKTDEVDPIQTLSNCSELFNRIIETSSYLENQKREMSKEILNQLVERSTEIGSSASARTFKKGSYENKAIEVAFGKIEYIKAYAINMKEDIDGILDIITNPKPSKKIIQKYKSKFVKNVDFMGRLLDHEDNEEIINSLSRSLGKQIPWQKKQTIDQEDDEEEDEDEDDGNFWEDN